MGHNQQSFWDVVFFVAIVIAISVNLGQMLLIASAGFREISVIVVEKVSVFFLWLALARCSLVVRSFLAVGVSVSLVEIYVTLGQANSDEVAGLFSLAVACCFWGCVVRGVLMLSEENNPWITYSLRSVAVSLIFVSVGLAAISHTFDRAGYDIGSMWDHVESNVVMYSTVPVVSIVIAGAALQRRTSVFVWMFVGLLCGVVGCMWLLQVTGVYQYSIASLCAIAGIVVLDSALLRLALLIGGPGVERG